MLTEQRTFSIGSAAAELGCSTRRLQLAGRPGAMPSAHRDYNGRLCSKSDIVPLNNLGIGSRSPKLKCAEEVVPGA
jgi:hypothetical protein